MLFASSIARLSCLTNDTDDADKNDDKSCNLKITYRFHPNPSQDESSSSWHNLLDRKVIATGFPSDRPPALKGLELPLGLMADLASCNYFTEFDGSYVLKGFTSMDVPVFRPRARKGRGGGCLTVASVSQ